MNIKCHFIQPHSISNLSDCQQIPKYCNCINDMNCYKSEPESDLNLNLNSTDYCETFPNKITYEISQKKSFNPIIDAHLLKNNDNLNILSYRSSSEIKYNNNYINNNSNLENKSKSNFRNYIQDQNRKKELVNGECINYRSKVRNIADGIYNDINKKKLEILIIKY